MKEESLDCELLTNLNEFHRIIHVTETWWEFHAESFRCSASFIFRLNNNKNVLF